MTEEKCKNCGCRYHDDFCMLNCSYVGDNDSCKFFRNTPLDFDYKRIYRLCRNYVNLCQDYKVAKDLEKKCNDDLIAQSNEESYNFFFNCVLNDLHREMSLWKTRR